MVYILLGKILEKMEGEPLDHIVKRLALDPLSMNESCYNQGAGTVCAATELDRVTGAYIDGVCAVSLLPRKTLSFAAVVRAGC